jgi:hypothetical protein
LRGYFIETFLIFEEADTLSEIKGREYKRGWFGIIGMTTGNYCFYLQNKLIQTGQTGGQWYSDVSPLVFRVER